MRENTDNFIMKTTFSVMGSILSAIEKGMDDDAFDGEKFTAERFKISENRFARILDMMARDGYVSGIRVEDYGEPDSDDPFTEQGKYRRFGIKLDNPSLTVKGIRFQAENTVLMRAFKAVKGFGDVIGCIKP